jgi:hypothetical protein
VLQPPLLLPHVWLPALQHPLPLPRERAPPHDRRISGGLVPPRRRREGGGGLVETELGGAAGELERLTPPCPDADSGGVDRHRKDLHPARACWPHARGGLEALDVSGSGGDG